MTDLSARDIEMLIEKVGSAVLVAQAAHVDASTNPQDWANGKFTPTDGEMLHLVALNDIMDELTRTFGRRFAQDVMLSVTSIIDDIRWGDFSAAQATVAAIVQRGGLA